MKIMSIEEILNSKNQNKIGFTEEENNNNFYTYMEEEYGLTRPLLILTSFMWSPKLVKSTAKYLSSLEIHSGEQELWLELVKFIHCIVEVSREKSTQINIPKYLKLLLESYIRVKLYYEKSVEFEKSFDLFKTSNFNFLSTGIQYHKIIKGLDSDILDVYNFCSAETHTEQYISKNNPSESHIINRNKGYLDMLLKVIILILEDINNVIVEMYGHNDEDKLVFLLGPLFSHLLFAFIGLTAPKRGERNE